MPLVRCCLCVLQTAVRREKEWVVPVREVCGLHLCVVAAVCHCGPRLFFSFLLELNERADRRPYGE